MDQISRLIQAAAGALADDTRRIYLLLTTVADEDDTVTFYSRLEENHETRILLSHLEDLIKAGLLVPVGEDSEQYRVAYVSVEEVYYEEEEQLDPFIEPHGEAYPEEEKEEEEEEGEEEDKPKEEVEPEPEPEPEPELEAEEEEEKKDGE